MAANPTIDTSTHALPKTRRPFLDATAPRYDTDEQAALDGPKERGAPKRQIALEVRHTFIEKSRGPAKRDRCLEHPPGTPLVCLVTCGSAGRPSARRCRVCHAIRPAPVPRRPQRAVCGRRRRATRLPAGAHARAGDRVWRQDPGLRSQSRRTRGPEARATASGAPAPAHRKQVPHQRRRTPRPASPRLFDPCLPTTPSIRPPRGSPPPTPGRPPKRARGFRRRLLPAAQSPAGVRRTASPPHVQAAMQGVESSWWKELRVEIARTAECRTGRDGSFCRGHRASRAR